jgi:addiction module HigA family antidote
VARPKPNPAKWYCNTYLAEINLPGNHRRDSLAAELARIVGVPANRISQIIAGKRNITADTALRLGRYFGTGPRIWLNLQTAYELDLAQERAGKEIEGIPCREPQARV